MKYFKKNIKLLLALAIVVLLIFSWLVYYSKPKTYNSESMKISFEVPTKSSIENKFASITIKIEDGEILVSRNSTNFSDLNSYLDSLHLKNKTKVLSSQNLEIDKHQAVKQTLVDDTVMSNRRVVYFIYIVNRVYLISTSSPELYDELDQIAQSFKYIGN